MKYLSLVILLIFIAATSSCQKSIDQKIDELNKQHEAFEKKTEALKNDTLKKQARVLGGMLFALEKMDLENQRVPKTAEYTTNSMAILDDYPSTGSMVDNYINGLLINQERDSPEQKDLKIIYPFELPFQNKANWTNVQLADNTLQPLIGEDKYKDSSKTIQAVKSHDLAFNEINIYYPAVKNGLSAQPAALVGEITAVAPQKIYQFKFSKDEAGQTKEQGGIKVKLVNVKDHAAKIEVTDDLKIDHSVNTDDLDWVKMQAKDNTKQFLEYSGSSSGSDDITKYYHEILNKIIDHPDDVKALEKSLETTEKEFSDKNKDKYFKTVYFKGLIQDLIVYVFDYSKVNAVKKQLNARVYKFEGSNDGAAVAQISPNVTVYDHDIAGLLTSKDELKETELTSAIKIEQTPYSKEVKGVSMEQNGKVEFNYPKVLSNLFLDDFGRYGDVKSVKFYDKKNGTEIKLPADSVSFTDHTASKPWAEFQVNRIEYNPAKFPAKPGYVAGVIEVNIADITKSNYGVNSLPAGMKINGNQLVIDGNVLKDQSNKYFVKDKTGRYLKLITSKHYQAPDLGYTIVNYYYGLPYAVDRYEENNTKAVNYNFGVELEKQ